MIKFEATNLEELEEETRLRANEISVAILTAICDAIDTGADAVSLNIISNLNLDIGVAKSGYLEALKLNIVRASEAEEFELCAKVDGYIKLLELEKQKEG